MKKLLKALVESLEKSYVSRLEDSDLIQAYYGEDDTDFSDWMTGNFNDDVDTGTRIGSYAVAVEVISKLQEIIESN